MINIFLIHYYCLALWQRRFISIVLSFLLVSVGEIKNIQHVLEYLHTVQKKYHLATVTLMKQNQFIQQTAYFIAKTEQAQTLLSTKEYLPTEIQWLGVLKKETHCWVFLKQANQTIAAVAAGTYLAKTHWQIIRCDANQIVLENTDTHQYFTRGFA